MSDDTIQYEKLPETPDSDISESSKEEAELEALNTDVEQKVRAVYSIPVQISVVLGRATMPVHHLLKLSRGSIIELDRKVGEAVDVYVNNRLIARGEVVIIDNYLGIAMTEIIKNNSGN